MELIIKNKLINAPIPTILNRLKSECKHDYLHYIGPDKNDHVAITCPFHKNGQERRPSCFVYTKTDDPDLPYGTVHCFTCGRGTTLPYLVGYCLGGNVELGNDWLEERFGDTFIVTEDYLPPIELDKKSEDKNFLDENILNQYAFYHPYMFKRKLTNEVINKFKIGYDKNTDCITFPIWDEKGNLVSISRRSTKKKYFKLENNIGKPIYLLNFIKAENITTVYVVESQINALTLWSWGMPAIALLGTGSKAQYEILRNSGIRNYILCFDGDLAGKKGEKRFIENMRKNVIVSVKEIPAGKDVNDLTEEEFRKIPIK